MRLEENDFCENKDVIIIHYDTRSIISIVTTILHHFIGETISIVTTILHHFIGETIEE